MAARQSKRARKSSDGPQEVEHLSLCGARGERGKRGCLTLERYYSTLKYLYDVLTWRLHVRRDGRGRCPSACCFVGVRGGAVGWEKM